MAQVFNKTKNESALGRKQGHSLHTREQQLSVEKTQNILEAWGWRNSAEDRFLALHEADLNFPALNKSPPAMGGIIPE